MPRPRDPRRDKAKKDWLKSKGEIKLVDLAEKYKVSSSTIRKWKATDKWDNENKRSALKSKRSAPKRHGAPKGNQNAIGNKGGAAPPGNRNAVTTGEYESIYEDVLTDEERSLFYSIDTTPLMQIEENIKVLSIRERRMLKRISEVMEGLTQKEKKVLQQLQSVKDPIEVHDEKTGKMKIVTRKKDELVTKQVEEREYRKIDDVLKVEDALTRVQNQKVKAIKLKHDIEYGFEHKKFMDQEKLYLEKSKANIDEGDYEDDGFIEALGDAVEVWKDDRDDGGTEET
ncbi:phage terminase small subunit [Halobacillus sp. A5]|uniref:phage terminase small subunit n=1 Tax=Halobacillus sp. A5 TaxID=2880263 RepID=UPI0020A6CF71|nr:phage terminase small subunit [Halobacillus sp. A5]MCP3026616.1 terminase [Halobacillus sp. A5]